MNSSYSVDRSMEGSFCFKGAILSNGIEDVADQAFAAEETGYLLMDTPASGRQSTDDR